MGKPNRTQSPPVPKSANRLPTLQAGATKAPPCYRPQATPKCLQTKVAGPGQMPPRRVNAAPMPPPVYRPQPAQKVLLAKRPVTGQPGRQQGSAPAAPPVYRPQPPPKVLQRKPAHTQAHAAPRSSATAPSRPVGVKVATPPHTVSVARPAAPAPPGTVAHTPGRTGQWQGGALPAGAAGNAAETLRRRPAPGANVGGVGGTIQRKPFVPSPEHNFQDVDIGTSSWTKTKLKELLASYPYQMQARYAPVIQKRIQEIEYAELYQAKGTVALLERVRSDYGIGDPKKYVFLPESEWNVKARELNFDIPDSHQNYGGTVGGPAYKAHPTPVSYMFVGEHHLRRWLEQGEIGSIIEVIKHEYTHVKQFHDPAFQAASHPIEVWEIDAYWREIKHLFKLAAQGREELLPEDKQMREAVYGFITYLESSPPSVKNHPDQQNRLAAAKEMRNEMQVRGRKPHLAILMVLDRGRYDELYGLNGVQTRLSRQELKVAEDAVLDEETLAKRNQYEPI